MCSRCFICNPVNHGYRSFAAASVWSIELNSRRGRSYLGARLAIGLYVSSPRADRPIGVSRRSVPACMHVRQIYRSQPGDNWLILQMSRRRVLRAARMRIRGAYLYSYIHAPHIRPFVADLYRQPPNSEFVCGLTIHMRKVKEYHIGLPHMQSIG